MKKVEIERLQRALKVKVTGKFDDATEKAVIAYQKRKGLQVDGVVGMSTHSMLY
ncbi:peptidoglycan-binding domain-containing protein [Staphylococcus aureus]|uniref:peptidoglycan-binding domain-containing protein n=1 Tax=Staphylococcus aureus TaxID=1280 RepID=UPI003D7E4234